MRVRAFAARRPLAGKESQITAPPYDVLTRAEALRLAAGHPDSILYVTRPEIAFPQNRAPTDDAVYAAARRRYRALKAGGLLTAESSARYYLYEQQLGDWRQRGLAALFHVDDYENGKIRRHETTRRDKQHERTRLLQTVKAQPGMVLLACRDTADFNALLNCDPPGGWLYDFQAADGVRHRLGFAGHTAALQKALHEITEAYIADGHHRAAAAAAAARSQDRDAAAEWFPAVLFPAGSLQLLPYHRCVRSLENFEPAAFRKAVSANFEMSAADPAPALTAGTIRLLMPSGCWDLRPRPSKGIADDSLDVDVLQKLLLQPLLGIEDPRSNPNLDFVGGESAWREIMRRLQTGEAAAAFLMAPLTIPQMMAVADAGGCLPPKSTWFEPKLLEGLLIFDLEDPLQ